MKIAILGASGFIGKKIHHFLDSQQMIILPFDSKNFNLLNKETWNTLPKECDCIILAAGTMVNDQTAYHINSDPIPDLTETLLKTKLKKIIYLSSGVVYGSYAIPTHPSLPCKTNTPYGLSKLRAEQSLMRLWPRDLNILRLYFPYGIGQKTPRLIPNLIAKIIQGEKIECNEDGGPYLTLSHIEDLISALWQDFIVKDNPHQIVNLASNYVTNMKNLCGNLGNCLNIKPKFIYTGESDNSISRPYDFTWKKSGIFNELFKQASAL